MNMSVEKLKEALELHRKWLFDEKGGKRLDLRGANLSNADLRGANLENVSYSETTSFFALQCPEEGCFYAFKVCGGKRIVKLFIPSDAKRSSATSRKCRCSKAIVVDITSFDGATHYTNAYSKHDRNFEYKVGECVEVDDFDTDRWNECSTGIHFFMTRQEAINYN